MNFGDYVVNRVLTSFLVPPVAREWFPRVGDNEEFPGEGLRGDGGDALCCLQSALAINCLQ